MDPLRGAGEVHFACDGDEVLELAKFHISQPINHVEESDQNHSLDLMTPGCCHGGVRSRNAALDPTRIGTDHVHCRDDIRDTGLQQSR
jgi:hypothetical protein